MKRFTGLLNKSKSTRSVSLDTIEPADSLITGQSGTDFQDFNNAPVDSPQANAGRAVRLFCESGGPTNRDEEVLHLPVIVEAAESSPQAAAAAAQQIRSFLAKSYGSKPHVQYNAIMLVRILSDNPGPTFTRNIDQSFVKTIKELLRGGKDQSTQQILRETLDALEVNKGYDEGLQLLLQMWRKEKGGSASLSHQPSRRTTPRNNTSRGLNSAPPNPNYQVMPPPQQEGGQRSYSRHKLPPPHELASRIEEAKNTAKILLQLIQSTSPEEVMHNELIREFSERCQSAQKSMQSYINCDSPAPDDDTMLTLIETNEQLSLAASRHHRAVLAARRVMGANSSPNPEAMNDGYGAFSTPAAPGQRESLLMPAHQPQQTNGFGSQAQNGYSSPPQNGFGGVSQNNRMSNVPQTVDFSTFSASPPRNGYGSPPLQQNGGFESPTRSNTRDSLYESTYNPSSGPPPQQYGGGFASSPRTNNRDSLYESDTYQAPPGPPPQHMLTRLQSRDQAPSPPRQVSPPQGQATLPDVDGPSDPFADPMEHHDNPAPLAIEPTNYGAPRPNAVARRPVPSQAFSIDAGSDLSSLPSHQRRNTADLENAYDFPHAPTPSTVSAVSDTSPVKGRAPSDGFVSPTGTSSGGLSPQRPGPGAWHSSGVSSSYIGRQTSAANGLTMHGAGSNDEVSEIDGHSQVGRSNTASTEASSSGLSGYTVSPVLSTAQQARRVDVAGTGGLKGPGRRY